MNKISLEANLQLHFATNETNQAGVFLTAAVTDPLVDRTPQMPPFPVPIPVPGPWPRPIPPMPRPPRKPTCANPLPTAEPLVVRQAVAMVNAARDEKGEIDLKKLALSLQSLSRARDTLSSKVIEQIFVHMEEVANSDADDLACEWYKIAGRAGFLALPETTRQILVRVVEDGFMSDCDSEIANLLLPTISCRLK